MPSKKSPVKNESLIEATETEIEIPRSQLENLSNKLNSLNNNYEDEKIERIALERKNSALLNTLDDMAKKYKILDNELSIYKNKKKSYADIKIEDFNIEERTKQYEEKLARRLKEADREIMEIKKRYVEKYSQ